MSFTSALDDFMRIKKRQDKNRLPYNPPLQQGKTYLRDRSTMCQKLKGNLNLIEGFQGQTSIREEANAGSVLNLTQPVEDRNATELQQLQEMQRSFQATVSEWSKKYQQVITLAKGQPQEMQRCLAACSGKKDVDTISACMYGCNTGDFASRGPTARATQNPGGPPFWAIFADAVSGGGVAAAAAISGGISEGFTPNAPNTAGQASDSTPSNAMGTYGPSGHGKVPASRPLIGNAVNTLLASNPVKGNFDLMQQFNNTNGWNFTKGNPQADNPTGQFALRNAALTNATVSLSKSLGSDPLVVQMANTNIDATNIGQYLTKLRKNWKHIFQKSCKLGIGGFGNVDIGGAALSTGEFAGHTQNCKSWVPTSGGRSGFYDIQAGTTPYTVDPVTGEKKEFRGVPIPLTNRGTLGCDTVIPGTRDYSVDQGGAGFCECADGTMAGYVDEGHPSFTCNQACAPQNKALRSQALYHNTKNWKPPLPYNQYHGRNTTVEGFTSSTESSPHCAPYKDEGLTINTAEVVGAPANYAAWFGNLHGLGSAKGSAWQPESAICPVGKCAGIEGTWAVCTDKTKPAAAPPAPAPPAAPPIPKTPIQKPPPPPPQPTVADKASAPFLQCGKLQPQANGTYTQGAVPNCPSGMKAAPGPVSPDPRCGKVSWDRERRTCHGFMGICWFGGWEGVDRDAGSIVQNGRRCMVPAPAGYSKPMVDNTGKLGKLPTKSQLLDACDGGDGEAPYPNIYLDMLELKVLGLVMEQKAAIIYKVIKESYNGSNAAALKRSSAGRSVLKNMKLYEGAYKRLRAQENLNMQRGGMLEDVRLKNKSTNISYYLWFALAISGMGLVIKKLNT